MAYENPKVVVGSVVVAGDAVLMCRRAIDPRRGFWTLPAGYLELGETVEEGARREAWEEARARIALDGILGVFSISRIGQVQVIFRARFEGAPAYAAGEESLEVGCSGPTRSPGRKSRSRRSTGRWTLGGGPGPACSRHRRATGTGPRGVNGLAGSVTAGAMRRRAFLAAMFGTATIGAAPRGPAPILLPDENIPSRQCRR